MKHLFLVFWAFSLSLQASEVYFTFTGEKPGVARVTISDGKIQSLTPLAPDLAVIEPFKMARTVSGQYLAVAAGGKDAPTLLVYSLKDSAAPREIPLQAEISDLGAAGEHFVVAASKGLFYGIDAAAGAISSEWSARKGLSPPGRKGEHIRILPDGRQALVSFQKDDDNNEAKGNRLILLDLDPLALQADLPLPRDREDLHLPGDTKEQGPGPEVVMISKTSNTLAVTLDLYGAVALADLDAALEGKWKNLTSLPTALDASWGTSFPDRGTICSVNGTDYLLISNASENGGFALFDLKGRELVQTFPTSAGADAPIFFPTVNKALTVVTGKIKSRTYDGLKKESAPGETLQIFDLAPLASGGPVEMTSVPLPGKTHRIVADGDNTALVFLESEVLLVDTTGTILDRHPLPGQVIRAL